LVETIFLAIAGFSDLLM